MFTFFINFKTYPQATGERAVGLAKICAKVARQEKIEIIPLVQVVDLFRINQIAKGPIWAQHTDWQEPGQATGWVNLEAIMASGASGTLLNHSEHRLPPGTIKQVVKRAKGLNDDFGVMVCGGTLGQLKRLVFTKPDYLAYEIKGLIGGKDSITKVSPGSVRKAITIAKEKNIPLILGPIFGFRTKLETRDMSYESIKIINEKGILASLMCDHPVIHLEHASIQAATALRYGAREEDLLKMLTVNPAKILGLEDRLGTIEVNKDADLVVWSGHPFDPRSYVEKTLINGKVVYEAE
ncbi:MAG: Amidohydrolase [Petrotoga mobilis]|nr:MAG: Amidohydrolase [Petrotoga mobilis]